MAKKRFRTKHEWKAIQDAYEQSGLSQHVFCGQNNLSLSSFCRWRQLLTESDVPAKETNLVKIEKPVHVPNTATEISTGYCRIILKGMESEQQLATIFRALRTAGNDY